MQIVLFEDKFHKNFNPLIHTRSISELKLGTSRLYERVASVYEISEKINCIVRDEVNECVSENQALNVDFEFIKDEDYLFINSAAVVENVIDINSECIALSGEKVSYALLSGERVNTVSQSDFVTKSLT